MKHKGPPAEFDLESTGNGLGVESPTKVDLAREFASNAQEFAIPLEAFDEAPTDVRTNNSPVIRAVDPESALASFAKGKSYLTDLECDLDAFESNFVDSAEVTPNPIFAAMIEQAQAAAAAAGWVCYTTEDGRQAAVRPEKIHGNPRAGLIRGNPDAAQRLYGYFAKEALERGDGSAAEDARHLLELPMILTSKPTYVIGNLVTKQQTTNCGDCREELGPYYWAEGVASAIRSGTSSLAKVRIKKN